MRTKTIIYYLAIGFLILGVFLEEVECRRKVLQGRKTITRRYYKGSTIAAWVLVLIAGLVMIVLGGGLYLILKKLIIDESYSIETHSYHPAMQDEV